MEPQQVKPNPWIVPFSIIIAGALIGGGIYMSSQGKKSFPNGSDVRQQTIEAIPLKEVSNADHILGNPNAQIMIVEYSDTECPYCKIYHKTMDRIMSEYGPEGKVARVYRHFPLHKQSIKEAVATECAAKIGGNDMFWKYLDQVYARTNSNDTLDLNELPKIAKDLSLDSKSFNDCLTNNQTQDLVIEDFNDAKLLKISGTPYSVLVTRDGQKISIEGAQPYEVIKGMIDAALEQ